MAVELARFSERGLFGAVVSDDFCPFAADIRDELLSYPAWKPMRLGGASYGGFQTAITTGHIQGRFPELKNCHVFSALLAGAGPELCALAGADPTPPLFVDMQAMAYGQGGRLVLHTDSISARRVAWILYLTHPDDNAWTEEDGGTLILTDRAQQRLAIHPAFNRFAVFRVADDAWHEITPIRRATPWDRCRLALSGWLNARVPKES